MRLDRFLWFARIVKTRSQAQDLAASGHLRIDGQATDKPAAAVRIGSVLAFANPAGRVRALRIELLPTRRGPPDEGRACYADLLEKDLSIRATVDGATARA
jgi:ribosome-associated heat shock protein Hsp15